MKKIISVLTLSFLLFNSCEANRVIVNREVESTKDGKMLLGTQTKSQLTKEPYSSWYNSEYDSYEMDAATAAELKKEKINSHNIVLVMGTWCEDSHREVPRLMKILEAVGFPDQKLTIISVNRKKESPSGEEGVYNIQKVPTIIVKKYGHEIGRIIETPKSGWIEKDLLEIIRKDQSGVKDIFK